MTALLSRLEVALAGTLPGTVAHLKMAPEPLGVPGVQLRAPTRWRHGAVLILLYSRGGDLQFVLTRRTERVRHHKGQISLPGGARHRREELVQTALRETSEELGISTSSVRVLGALSPVNVPVSGFCIHPFVAYESGRPIFIPDPTEVAGILEVPLAHLLDPVARQTEDRWDPRFEMQRRVPYFRIDDWVVWGATAMILSELAMLLEVPAGTP